MEAFHRREQVSRTLEYAYDDFVLAEVAKKLGKTDDYNALVKRAGNYRNVIDPETGYAVDAMPTEAGSNRSTRSRSHSSFAKAHPTTILGTFLKT